MKKPLVSVIMLFHNREQYIERAIASVIRQTYENIEFILINNNSTDKSIEIAKKYQKEDSRISIYKSKTSNIGAGRNLGLNHARGEYFTFIDDDDYCESDFIEFLVEMAEENNADIAVCGSEYDTDGVRSKKYSFDELIICNRKEALENLLLRKYFNNGNATKLFRRTQEICRIKYPEIGQYDDIHTMYKFFSAVSEKGGLVVAKGEPKYIVCRHNENNSAATLDFSKITSKWLEEYLAVYRERTIYIADKISDLEALAKWSEWSYMISMVEKINRFQIANCSEQLKYMIAELKENRQTFLTAKWTRDFEKKWMEEYINEC